nr:hypothetical protein [Tanacetum cinerariifolium]
NQNSDAVNDNIRGDISRGCTYKEFLAYNPKKYDGTVAATGPETIQKAVQIADTLTDEALRNGSINKNPEKRGNGGEPTRDRNVRDDNKRTRTGNVFAITANPVKREYTGTTPKCTTCNYHHSLKTPCRSCFNYNRLSNFSKDCRVAPRNVNPVNSSNPVTRNCYECASTDHIKSAFPRNTRKQARGKAVMLGAEDARQDPNIMTAQVGDQGRGQENGRNQNSDAVNDNIRGDISRGCTYKEFLACNPKKYDGKGGSYVVKFSNPHTRKRGHCRITSWSGLAMLRILIGFMSWLATGPETIQKAMQIADTMTDEALRNGSINKNPEKRGNGGEPTRDRNVRDDNKRTRTGNVFATTANPVKREYTGTTPKCTTCNYHHSLETPCRSCFNYNRLSNFSKDCSVAPRNVNPVNSSNPVARTCYECGSIDHIKSAFPRNTRKQARGKAFMLGAEEDRQDPNIMTGIESTDLGFSYEIEIASR